MKTKRNKIVWRMEKKCADCPFATSGPGLHLRQTLRPGRMESIEHDLLNNKHFTCHKTSDETGDGTNLVCAGAIEWQDAKGVSANYVRVCERLAGMFSHQH